MRMVEAERQQLAVDLGLNSQATWSEIHRAQISKLFDSKRAELARIILSLHAVKIGIPETSTTEEIVNQMLMNQEYRTEKKQVEVQLAN